MDDIEDDDWVREFDVSNPQKTHAGYTVYRVSSKVYPRGFPEAASEVIVFKRYKEIHMLYKELKTIYENKNAEKKQFPQFSKASYFSRFDESVIEERCKQALLLLNFAGRIYFLFTSQPFVKFFEGGIKNISRSLSKDSSDSDQQCNDEGTTQEENGELEFWTPQPYFNNAERNLEINSSDDETFETNKDLPDRDFSLDLKHEIVSSDTSLPKESAKERWLARAISLCSEGDDIETLASEAGRDENELGRQKENRADIPEVCEPTGVESHDSQPSQGSVDLLPTLLESSEGEDEDVFVDIVSSKFGEANNTGDNVLQTSQGTSAKKDVNEGYVYVKSLADVGGDDTKCTEQRDTTTKLQEIKPTDRKGGKTGKNKKGVDQIAHIVSNIGVSWIDPRKKDYLFEAAQVIQQALYCEANELYEDAFNRYKMCVGILLKGVQHDSNSKRREAVRRKTAQYLVKAEFLFNTYLKQEDNGKSGWTIKSSNTSQDFALESIVDRQFCQLTLRSLKVIGIIKKVMLVQCLGLEGVFVLKVLHKTNAVHRSSRQENKQTTKGHSKKYIKSPYMVTLHRHFDTNNSIFLLLEYASGGALWNHINSLRQQKVVTDEPSRDKRSPVRTTEEESKGDLVSRDDENLCRNSDDPNVGKEYLVSLDCPVNSKSGIWTSSNDTCKTDLICETTLCVEKSDEEIKTETSEGKEHVSENVPSITNTHEPFSRTTNHSSIDKTDLAQETAPSKPEGSCGVSIREHVTTTSDVLGYLDYVTHVNQVNDRCVQRWVAELLLAIASLHSCGIIMKDLKPENVLMDDNGHLILSYFGSWEEVDHSIDPEAVEHLYCAPEISCGERISFASDWWSLGVLSYELVTGKSLSSSHPWGIHSHSSINFPSDNISPEARSFLTGLICHNASERLGSGMNGVEEIRSHAFFKGIDWDELSKRS